MGRPELVPGVSRSDPDPQRSTVAVLQAYLRPCRIPLLEGLAGSDEFDLSLVLYGAVQERRLWGQLPSLDHVSVDIVQNREIPVSYEKSFFLPMNLRRVLNSIDPVAVVGSFDIASLIASDWCRRKGRQFVVWSEETSEAFSRSSHPVVRVMRRRTRRLQLARAAACIVPGLKSHQHVESFGYTGPIYVGPNSVEHEDAFKLIGRRRAVMLPSFEEGFRVLYSGSLVSNKGIDTLVYNWDRLTDESPRPITLHVAGTGPLEDALRRKSRARIVFHGHLQGDQYHQLFRDSHAFILPSHIDRNPLVVIEALWTGLPLIVSGGVGSWPEAVGENGFVIDVTDLDSIRNALVSLAGKSSDELMIMSQDSLRRAEGFSTETAVEGFRRALQDVVRSEDR